MDLLIVGHVFLSKDAFNLVEVPIRNARHVINLFGRSPHMSVLTVEPVNAETKSVVVALTVGSLMRSSSPPFIKAATILSRRSTRLISVALLPICIDRVRVERHLGWSTWPRSVRLARQALQCRMLGTTVSIVHLLMRLV